MSNNCQLVAMGQQTNIWRKDCAWLCSDCGNWFNPACVLNQQALPYWVGRQCSSETFQTKHSRVRGIPGFIFCSIWSKGEGLGPQGQNPASKESPVQLVLYSFKSWFKCHCQLWGCESPAPSGPSLPVAYTIQLLISSVSNIIKPLPGSGCILFWVSGKQKESKKKNCLIPCCLGDYILLGIHSS